MLAVERWREAETRQLALQVLAREAELKALRTQIDPHFLFNSLHSISALTTVDPAGARRMCLLLGEFLRLSLKLGAEDRIPLAEEMALVDRFLGIEQVRFGDRLRASVTLDPGAAACEVPPLLLQPLVENAARHGVAELVDGGLIDERAVRRGDRVIVSVENPCDPDRRVRAGAGVGWPTCGGGSRPRSARPAAWTSPSGTAGSEWSWRCPRCRRRTTLRPRDGAVAVTGPRQTTGADRMRVVVVDDEPLARAMLRELLADHPDVEVVAECGNGFDAVKAVADLAPDLLLLDIQMPKLDGFEVLELVGREQPVIFITAFDEYAIKAFEVHAVDYLLKPFSADRLTEALGHARTRTAQGDRPRWRR